MKINVLIKKPTLDSNGTSGAMSGVSHLKGSIKESKNATSFNPQVEKMHDSDFRDVFNSQKFEQEDVEM